MKVVQEWRGHREVKITINNYPHLYSHEFQRAPELLDGVCSTNART
jgi:hypothetical protein